MNPFLANSDIRPTVARELAERGRPWSAMQVLVIHLGVSGGDAAALVDVGLVEAVLERAAMGPSDESHLAARNSWEAGRLLDHLESAGSDISTRARLEFLYIHLLQFSRRTRALSTALATDPALFAELFSYVHPAEEDKSTERGPHPGAPGHRPGRFRRHPVLGQAARRPPRRDHRRRPTPRLGDRGPSPPRRVRAPPGRGQRHRRGPRPRARRRRRRLARGTRPGPDRGAGVRSVRLAASCPGRSTAGASSPGPRPAGATMAVPSPSSSGSGLAGSRISRGRRRSSASWQPMTRRGHGGRMISPRSSWTAIPEPSEPGERSHGIEPRRGHRPQH